eukprot:10088003-Alexandrium_andersonii.AAC.1
MKPRVVHLNMASQMPRNKKQHPAMFFNTGFEGRIQVGGEPIREAYEPRLFVFSRDAAFQYPVVVIDGVLQPVAALRCELHQHSVRRA